MNDAPIETIKKEIINCAAKHAYVFDDKKGEITVYRTTKRRLEEIILRVRYDEYKVVVSSTSSVGHTFMCVDMDAGVVRTIQQLCKLTIEAHHTHSSLSRAA